MPLQATTSLRKIAGLTKPIRAIRGGQGAGKTISILILLIDYCSRCPNKEVLIISAELTKMRLTVIKDFVKLMREIGIYREDYFLAGTLYRFPNGSFIKFIGLDKEDVGKGLRCDVAYFNEVNKVNAESYRQVASRAQVVYADYNPDAEFYIDEDVIPRDDCDFLQLTFEDNELLSERERGEILRYYENGYNKDGTIKNKYWANLWQVYGLGNIGNLQGVVFENWEEMAAVPREAELIAYGQDFGFTNDPAALIAAYRWNGHLVAEELIYENRLLNHQLISKYHVIGIRGNIVADSADPKSIEEIRQAGFAVEASRKGPDSVRASIQKLQQFEKIYIVSNTGNFQKEMRSYRWKTDATGKSLNEPVDKDDHLINALQYVALNYLTRDTDIRIY